MGGRGAWVGDNLVVNWGAKTMDNWGRVCGMMVKGLSSWAFEDTSAKGFGQCGIGGVRDRMH